VKFNQREFKVIKFAVWRFMNHAFTRFTEAAQDRTNAFFTKEDIDGFHKDAVDAANLLKRLEEDKPDDEPLTSFGLTEAEQAACWREIVRQVGFMDAAGGLVWALSDLPRPVRHGNTDEQFVSVVRQSVRKRNPV
jgi:hypothetical protein